MLPLAVSKKQLKNMRNFLIDTDTASDDAVALIMALNYPNVNVEAITIVAGNVEVEQGVKNALYTVELCKKNVMVYQGASKPLVGKLQTAKHKRGQDGMSDIGLESTKTIAAEGNAIDVIINTVYKFPNEIEIVALGPLTNIAIAIAKEPNIIK